MMKPNQRKPIPPEVEAQILMESRRRCCLCAGLEKDYSEKKGQIAHINKIRNNNSESNLVFLCLNHHSLYDSTTSQHKNYTKEEILRYKNELNQKYLDSNSKYPENQTEYSLDGFSDSENIKYALSFDGYDNFSVYDSFELIQLQDYVLELKIKVGTNKLSGSILSAVTVSNKILYYVKYTSNDNKRNPNCLVLYINNGNKIEVAGEIKINPESWITVRLLKVQNTLTFEISQFNQIHILLRNNDLIRKIQLGTRGLSPIEPGKFLCSNIKLLNLLKDINIFDFTFENGYDYFKTLRNSEKMIFYNFDIQIKNAFLSGN